MTGSPSAPLDFAERLRRLQAVTDVALANLPLDELLEELLLRIRDALDADTAAFLLLDEAGEELVARAAKGIEEEVERGVRIPLGKGFAGRIAAERRPVVLDDVDHADVLNPILREKGIKSMAGVPLIAHDDVLGVVHVGTLTPRLFRPADVELLEVVAQRAAVAIDRALAHEQVVRLTQLQRDFIALAAHELRTPTTTVYGLAATLARRELDPEVEREVLETLYQQSERMSRLVEQLLDGSARNILDTVRRLGFLQIDPIATVAPPQRLVLWSRLGPYDVSELDRLLSEERKLFEWGAFIWPIEDYPLILARMRRERTGKYAWERRGTEFLQTNADFRRYLLHELERRGPLL